MQAPLYPVDEEERIEALRALLVLDSPPEERFDCVTCFRATAFQVPIALVSLIDVDRQWFKSAYGLDACETAREVSFCAHAILDDQVFVIEDALRDRRFVDNPLVLAPPHIRFYAGAPLKLKNGHRVGTLRLIRSARAGYGSRNGARMSDRAVNA